jgi:hypothetical protein
MPNINDIFPSKFLKSHELQGKTPTVTIERVGVEQVRSRTKVDTKAVLYFRGKVKGMLLNKTNAQSVAQIAKSPQTEAWTGVAITLYETTAKFGEDVHAVIRIKAPVPVQKGVNPQPSRSQRLQSAPRIFTDELDIDLADAGVSR